MSKIYKSVVLEVRPRLQSVNVLVDLVKTIANVTIQLNDNNFQIIANDDVQTVPCKNLKIVSTSLSSLIVAESYISFRFATDNSLDDWGGFKTELLRTQSSSSSVFEADIFINKSTPYAIQCKNCSQNLGDAVEFTRVLPLPSENAEPGDWFCHGHGGEISVLDPKRSDVFYTCCYCHLNKTLTRNVLVSDKLIVCKRCFSWLGLVKNSETCKLWFNTVVFSHKSGKHTTSALNDVFKALHEILTSILFNTAKVVLCCQSSKSKNDFILLWILEKQLNIQICSECGVNDCKVAKVLFRFESGDSELVKKWMDESNVVSVDVSKPMIVELLKHLYKYNKIFPKEFSESNNFYISYLMMYASAEK